MTEQWVRDAKVNWGEDSPMYQIRVLGDFPSESEDTLISLKTIENRRGGQGRGPLTRTEKASPSNWALTWRVSAVTAR